jgi:DNA polymerase I-like protein with 3'-5' exonuclease and polymerase domains
MTIPIITSIEEAQFLLEANEISVDIETDTRDLDGFGPKRGLSYVADITWVAMFTGGKPPVVFHMDPSVIDHDVAERDRRVEFIRQVLSRPGITIIGHNVGFDLRSLGGHYGFTLPIGTNAWDTQSLALLLLMIENANTGASLEVLESKYNLLSADDLAFSKRMKAQRERLHEQPLEDVLRYVMLDVVATWRLYRLQQKLIETSDDMTAEPLWTADMKMALREGKRFIASKHYRNLVDNALWEQKVSRWCANVAIRGIRVDLDYAKKHLERLVVEYHTSVEHVVDAARGLFDNSTLHMIQQAVDLERMIDEFKKKKRKLSLKKMVFRHQTFDDENGSIVLDYETIWNAHYYTRVWPDTPDMEGPVYFDTVVLPYMDALRAAASLPKKAKKAKQTDPGAVLNPDWEAWFEMSQVMTDMAAELLGDPQKMVLPVEPPKWVIPAPIPNLPPEPNLPPFDLEHWLAHYPPVAEYFNQRNAEDVMFRIRVLADWFRAYFKVDKEIDDAHLTNMGKFSPFYLFVVLCLPFPSNQEIYMTPELVTGKLKKVVDRATEDDMANENTDFRRAAHELRAWSMAEKSIKYYERTHKRKDDLDFIAFYRMQKNGARITRSLELQKHAQRDGRIHPVLARRAQTGRGSCGLPNLMNIPFNDKVTGEQVFTGYLLPDEDDQMLISLDISNAENFFAALTFGDSALAEACTKEDFHMAMTEIYWRDEVKRLREIIKTGAPDEVDKARKQLATYRKLSKAVTFGDAYGSGVNKTARQIGVSFEEAARIKDARSRRFAAMTRGKKSRAEAADMLYKQGVRPAYTELWTGRRVFIDEVWRERDGKKERELKSYTVANYLQQGGVGELVWRSIVLMDEYLESAGWKSRVALQLHDEIVIAVPIARAFDAARALSQIIASVVPEVERLVATVPHTQFLAALDKSNVSKWGWRADREYPLDLNVYVNQYGIHTLRDGEREAPTWLVDKHPQDTTIEDLYLYQYDQLVRYRDLYAEQSNVNAVRRITHVLRKLHKKLGLPEEGVVAKNCFEALEALLMDVCPDHDILQAKPLTIAGHNYGLLNFSARMTIFQQGYLAGKLPLDVYKKYVIDRLMSVSSQLTGFAAEKYRLWENFNYYGIDKPA